eukprot:4134822-Pleurochrysis_carterae.AAC.2
MSSPSSACSYFKGVSLPWLGHDASPKYVISVLKSAFWHPQVAQLIAEIDNLNSLINGIEKVWD